MTWDYGGLWVELGVTVNQNSNLCCKICKNVEILKQWAKMLIKVYKFFWTKQQKWGMRFEIESKSMWLWFKCSAVSFVLRKLNVVAITIIGFEEH